MNTKLLLAVFALVMLSANAMSIRNHEGQYAWYTFNEGPTGNKCTNANQCDGQRTCSPYGWCTGTSRPAKNANYKYNEAVTGNKCPATPSAANYANRNYYCDGNRTCSAAGWCQGTSR